MSRWVELYATSPSGKALFVCRMCGRTSPVPDVTCATPPEVYQKLPLPCELLEELEGALNEEQGNLPEVKQGKLILVAEKGTEVGAGCVRYTVLWRTLESQWNSTDLYMNKDLKK